MVKTLNPNVSCWKPVSLAMSHLRSLIPIKPIQSQVHTDPYLDPKVPDSWGILIAFWLHITSDIQAHISISHFDAYLTWHVREITNL